MEIAVLPGDDIGPEITAATMAVVEAANRLLGLGLRFTTHEVGMAAHAKHGVTLPDGLIDALRAADGVILGPAGMSNYPGAEQGGINVPGTIRKRLDLYANIRPFRSRPGIPHAMPGVDWVMVRENTEGFYSDRNMAVGAGEFMPTPDLALSVRKITAQASNRIARAAFELAMRRGRKVTAVHKKHVLKLTDGLFMREVLAVAKQFPDVALDEINVDALASALYETPTHFDVVLITNMFGDILSNLGAALSGGLGLAGALNAGDTHAAANAAHGSAPDIAGKDRANPTALILSSAMLLDWLGARRSRPDLARAARLIHDAVDAALTDPTCRTADIGGNAGTRAYAAAVVQRLEGLAARPVAGAAD